VTVFFHFLTLYFTSKLTLKIVFTLTFAVFLFYAWAELLVISLQGLSVELTMVECHIDATEVWLFS